MRIVRLACLLPSWRLIALSSALILCAAAGHSQSRTAEYVDLLTRYEADPGGLSRRLLDWTESDLREVRRDLHGWLNHELPVRYPDEKARPTRRQVMSTATLIHVHAARHARTQQELSRHLSLAWALWSLGERSGDVTTKTAADQRFIARCRALASTIWLGYLQWPEALEEADAALRLDNHDTQVLLAAAAVLETRAVAEQGRPATEAADDAGSASPSLSSAAELYATLLSQDSQAGEARLRYARVLHLLGRADEAAREIAAVPNATDEPYQRYWALLIAGGIDESVQRVPEAIAKYRRAHDLCRGCQSAAVALSHAVLESGDRQRAASIVEAAVTGGPARRRPRRIRGRVSRRAVVPGRPPVVCAVAGGVAMRLVAFATSCALLAPQDAPAPKPVFSTRVDAVRVDVQVTRKGKPLAGLTAADFTLEDAGVPQQIRSIAAEELPLDLFLVLDQSMSVTGEPLEALRQGVRKALAGLRAGDRASLVSFSHRVMLRTPLTSNSDAIEQAVAEAHAGGGTALHDAIYSTLLLRPAGDRRTLVVVFSDGVDTISWLPAPAVVDVAKHTDAIVYGVVLTAKRPDGPSLDTAFLRGSTGAGTTAVFSTSSAPQTSAVDRNTPSLDELAAATEGHVFTTAKLAALGESFEKAVRDMRARYVLTYVPEEVARTGWHPLTVNVRQPEARVVARRGYFAN